MSSNSSVISEKNFYTSYPEDIIFSTSPQVVFGNISHILYGSEIEEEIQDEENKKKHNYNYRLVMKDIIIYSLRKNNKKYQFGYRIYQGLINGCPYYFIPEDD